MRNFCIIAHIDHGKSTLADRLLLATGCIKEVGADVPTLDNLPVERERGITVKAQHSTMFYPSKKKRRCKDSRSLEDDLCSYEEIIMFNLVDTPGHVDFRHEVSKSISAVQSAILLIDATRGIQAQTIAHYREAVRHNLYILPVINKIDSPLANVDAVFEAIGSELGIDVGNVPVLEISAKHGKGIEELLEMIEEFPSPAPESKAVKTEECEEFLGTVIDCWHQSYKGTVCLVRIDRGRLTSKQSIHTTAQSFKVTALGIIQAGKLCYCDSLTSGQIGFIEGVERGGVLIGHKISSQPPISSKDPTLEHSKKHFSDNSNIKDASKAMAPKQSLIYTNMFPVSKQLLNQTEQSLYQLLQSDSSVHCTPINNALLGNGWKLGFLGSLHMQVFCERLKGEWSLDTLLTPPMPTYRVKYKESKDEEPIEDSEQYPDNKKLAGVQWFSEPLARVAIQCNEHSIGAIQRLLEECDSRDYLIEYGSEGDDSSTASDAVEGVVADTAATTKCTVHATVPMSEIIQPSFINNLLSLTAGKASLSHTLLPESQKVDLVKLGVLINGTPVPLLASLHSSKRAHKVARRWSKELAKLIPKQQFACAIQVTANSRIIARETVGAQRKDVIAKCYGGDKTRKMKLLEQQKDGKERARMKMYGKVQIDEDIFVKLLQIS